MVVTPSQADGRTSRAQLLLVGSVLMAAIIIGLVVVINTVLVTENVAKGESLDRARDAAQFDGQARANVRSVALRLNHDDRNVTGPALAANVEENFTAYSRLLAEAYALREPVWVDIEFDNTTSDWGRRIVNGTDGQFTSPDGDSNWQPIASDGDGDDPDYRQVGRFVLNLNVSETDTEWVYFNFTNATGESLNVSLKTRGAGPGANVIVDSAAQPSLSQCEPSDGRVLLDLLDGRAYTDDCVFAGPHSADLEGPYNLTITNGTHGYGRMEFTINESVVHDDGQYTQCPPSGEAVCQAPIVWTASTTVRYESEAILYEQDHEVDVYP